MEMDDEFAVVSDVNGDEDEDENADADRGLLRKTAGACGVNK